MKRHLTKSRIIGYLLLFTVMTLLVLSVTYSRFMSMVEGDGKAVLAVWEAQSDALTIDVDGMKPGMLKTYEFYITNSKDGVTSDVAQNYTVTVESTNNLPLTYRLSPAGDGQEGTVIQEQTLDMSTGKSKMAGGRLPHTTAATHEYILNVTWPQEHTEAGYADEIDMVTLTVEAEQDNTGMP
ncbi:hypothetical protein DWW31_08995 [Clostridium sp. AF15-17LB]|nr:hypothetical protein DWW31_08995 [Clostridium sp. AF15-17LB]